MILVDWGHNSKNLATLNIFRCNHCNSTVNFKLIENRQPVSIYFVPIIRWSKKYFMSCPICKYGHEISQEEAIHLLRTIVSDNIGTIGSKRRGNINYKDISDIRNTVEWIIQNDVIASELLDYFNSDIIANLSLEIHTAIRNTNTNEEFINQLIESTAFFDMSYYIYIGKYNKYKYEWESNRLNDIPRDTIVDIFKHKAMSVYLFTKIRIISWIYNLNFNRIFKPADYEAEIEEFIYRVTNDSNKGQSNDNRNQYYKNGKLIDYYEILEVHRKASNEIINRAYKTLAMKYHPDVNPNNDTNLKMIELNEAYEILNNKESRDTYNIIFDAANEKIKQDVPHGSTDIREEKKEVVLVYRYGH